MKKKIFIIIAVALLSSGAAAAYTVPHRHDFINTRGREEVDCAKIMTGGQVMVALAFGQSNAANSGETRLTPRREVYSFYDGRCYKAKDPMLGAGSSRGSVWSRLGDKIIDAGMYDRVVFVTIAVCGTEIKRWAPGGNLHGRILDVSKQLRQKNIKVTHIFWHQGESDRSCKTPSEDYQRMFLDMLKVMRRRGLDAPVFVAEASRCGTERPSRRIQKAQRALVNPSNNIFAGPNTDKLWGKGIRFDGCHFSTVGLEKHADLWLKSIKAYEKRKKQL